MTNDLKSRVWQHKSKRNPGFTSKYDVSLLVYYESHRSIEDAIKREKQIKAWRRAWKLELIEERNPKWQDLFDELM